MISNTVILESAMVSNDELVKQHAKVAEDAFTPKKMNNLLLSLFPLEYFFLVETFSVVVFQGWEKAENEVFELNQKLEDAGMPRAGKENIVLQDRVKSSQWGSNVLDK
ncbi:unnamed protein product [Brassica rapa]|uniref:Uncharacterized protein n=1 Tax=Brassica campestris TaxID=3711 RepID=A0A8D9M5S9_BRACM|nr:unnamed protein product [Brassica rapa]